jgi:hypothetical protein
MAPLLSYMAREPDPPEAQVDDRYTNGIYYDAAIGDFCTIQRGDDGAELVNPSNGNVYHVVPYEEWNGQDFFAVPEEAVNDPVGYFETWAEQQSVRPRTRIRRYEHESRGIGRLRARGGIDTHFFDNSASPW